MRWQLSNPSGLLAGVPVEVILEEGGALAVPPSEVALDEALEVQKNWLAERLKMLEGPEKPAWLVLPEQERSRQLPWQEQLPGNVEVAFGRSGVTLALGQATRLGAPATVLAMDRVPGVTPGKVVTSQLSMDLGPGDVGLAFLLGLVDGRPDRPTDLSDMLEHAGRVATAPEVLLMPGTGNDDSLDRLMGSLAAMGTWVDQGIRWEFAEARIGPMGVAGSLFNRYWLQQGYRLGDWQGTAVVMDMDASPLAGLSVVDYKA